MSLSPSPSPFRRGLWLDADFVRLWSGATVSTFGSMLSGLALSFLAIGALDASPFQLAILNLCGLIPAFVAGPWVGVLADRVRRRPVMVVADVARALTVLIVPVAALLGVLGLPLLYAIAALMSVLSLSFDVANRSHLPWLVSRRSLTEANSKLTGAGSVAEAAAFSAGGFLVQWLTAPVVLVVDGVTYLLSALCVSRIRKPEPVPSRGVVHPAMLTEFVAGLRYVAASATLRALLDSTLLLNLFQTMLGTLYVFYVLEEIGLPEGVTGLSFALGGAAALAGAVYTGRITRRLGVGNAMVCSLGVAAVANLLVPLSTEANLLAFGLILAQQFLGDSALTVYEIADTSLIQAAAADAWQGRVHATLRMVRFGGEVLGTVAAGLLPFAFSVRPVMIVAALGMALAAIPVLRSPVRRLRDIPVVEGDEEDEEDDPGVLSASDVG